MAGLDSERVRAAVSAAYAARARKIIAGEATNCCAPDPTATAGCCAEVEAAAALPATVVSYGCGDPVAFADLRAGETVLDLGSGAGRDCFLAAERVGPTGRVIGLDMTDEMLALAEENRRKLGLENVEFRKGLIEAIPLPDASVDVILSNCVINLSPDKDAVFREAFRALRPGGRLRVADVVALRPFAAEEQANFELWAGCVSGALQRDDYERRLRVAGFEDVAIALSEDDEDRPWRSATITARKPSSTGARFDAGRIGAF